MNLILLNLYRLFFVWPTVVALPFLALFSLKIRTGLRLRRRKVEALQTLHRPIWIHASSGEFEYAKAVIRELKLRHAQMPIVVTYFSPTYANNIERFPGVDRAVALPLDLPGPVIDFLQRYRPRVGLIARTDLWPELLAQCQVRKVPVVLFSYTQKAFTNPFKRALTRWLMSYIQRIYCVSEVDREHLLPVIGSQTVEVLGDTRYDQVIERLKNPKPIVDVLRPRGVPVLVAGSTWPADEAVLLPALAPLLKAGRIKLILVPHEPTNEHLEALRLQLQKLGLNSERFSLQQSWDDKPVLLVDQVGFLAELYLWGDYAFVGGSFRKSVHSVMEALGAGALTFVGPFHHNNREALEFKNLQVAQHPALEVVSSSEELRERLTAALDSLDIRQFHQALRQEFHRRLGASGKLVNQIEDLLRS